MRGTPLLAANILLAIAIAVPCLAQKVDNQLLVTRTADSLASHSQTKTLPAKANSASTAQSVTYGDPPFTVHATSNSPGAITYRLVSGNATVTSAGLVTIIGAGPVIVEAMQAETPIYTAANTTANFSVLLGTPTITFNVPNVINEAPFAVSASSTSTGAFTYTVVSGPAQIAGSMVSFTGTGSVVLTASEAADSNYNAASKTVSFTVGAPTLTLAANNASRLYGMENPAFSGSVTGANPFDTFVETFSTTATSASAPGTYSVTPAASGASLSNYTVSTVNGTLRITQAPTLTTLSTNSTTTNPDQKLSLTAQVKSTTTGIPSGSVTLFDNGTALQTVPLVNGAASLVISSLPGVTHVLTAASSGDDNFLGSAQSPPISITGTPLDFAFAIQGETTELSAFGNAAAYTFSVSPLSGSFAGPVTFSVLGLPEGASAVFTPSTVASDKGPSIVKLYIQPAAQIARQHKTPDLPSESGIAVALIVLIWPSSRKLRQLLRGGILALVLLGFGLSGAVFLTGCGSGILQQGSGTYTLSVVATSGAIQHTQTVTLKMQ
jgi:MBG domain (YGX type)/Bacterial Ig-like domain (group 3)